MECTFLMKRGITGYSMFSTCPPSYAYGNEVEWVALSQEIRMVMQLWVGNIAN